jgi:hypothetical protein
MSNHDVPCSAARPGSKCKVAAAAYAARQAAAKAAKAAAAAVPTTRATGTTWCYSVRLGLSEGGCFLTCDAVQERALKEVLANANGELVLNGTLGHDAFPIEGKRGEAG